MGKALITEAQSSDPWRPYKRQAAMAVAAYAKTQQPEKATSVFIERL